MMTYRIREALLNPCVHFRLKDALRSFLEADPVDAVNDARYLYQLLEERADELLKELDSPGYREKGEGKMIIIAKKTKEQFQAQFETEIDFGVIAPYLQLDEIVCNTPVYRALEKLVVLKDDGKYYIHA